MSHYVEIFRGKVWVKAPVCFTTRAEAEDYCGKRGDKLTRVVKQ